MKPLPTLGPSHPLSVDTPRKVELMIVEGMRNWTPAQRTARMEALNRDLRMIVISSVRQRFPDANEFEVRMRVASRYLTREEMVRLFQWDPKEHLS